VARRHRKLYEGAVYHAGSRGNRRQTIFTDDRDRRTYLELLARTCRRYGWACHCYCLMGNHYHLLVDTPFANLDHGMRWLNGVYAIRFNRRHGFDGHLFQGRYWAEQVVGETELLRVVRYISRNPVEAGLCDRAEDWPWSSHRESIGVRPSHQPITSQLVLGMLGAYQSGLDQARERLRNLVEEPA
jgi:putative transposase